MGKKHIIITKEQFNHCINEEDTINIATQAKDNSLSSFSMAATNANTQSDIQKAKTAGDVGLTISGPNTDDSQPVQNVNVVAGDTLQNAITTQANDALIRNGGSVKVTGDGFGENKVYTKKAVEEARLAKMRNEGRVMTKRQLFEMVVGEQEDIANMLEHLSVFTVLEAYKNCLGNPDELATQWDMMGAIVKKYNEATPEQQMKFKQELGI